MKDTEQLTTIVSNLQKGNEEAAADLYNAYRDSIYYYILKTVKDPELAADLTQETFIEILQTIGSLKEPAAFTAWSRQIAYHKCTAHFRKNHDILVSENDDGPSVFDTLVEEREEFIPDEALEKQDLRQIIRRMIDSLPEEQRAAIMMRYFDELSVKEIAQIQAVSEGTVKSRLNYGRKAIAQSVKDYEKKSGIKLHCAGIIPLVLWLLKISGGFKSAGAATAAKAAGKLTAKKVIAGVTAAAVVGGGVTAGILLTKEPATEAETQPLPMHWYGYGEIAGYTQRRFDLQIEEMDDSNLTGVLEVTYLYETAHKSTFEGEGTVSEDSVVYTIKYETPATYGVSASLMYEYSEMTLVYNKETDQFIFGGISIYEVTMNRAESEPSQLLAKNEVWSGYGEDDFYNDFNSDHQFTLEITELRTDTIHGKLTVSYNGQTDHASEFSGRGYTLDGELRYEILLETPRSMNFIVEYTLGGFWLYYNPETETFYTPPLSTYSFEASKINPQN